LCLVSADEVGGIYCTVPVHRVFITA